MHPDAPVAAMTHSIKLEQGSHPTLPTTSVRPGSSADLWIACDCRSPHSDKEQWHKSHPVAGDVDDAAGQNVLVGRFSWRGVSRSNAF